MTPRIKCRAIRVVLLAGLLENPRTAKETASPLEFGLQFRCHVVGWVIIFSAEI